MRDLRLIVPCLLLLVLLALSGCSNAAPLDPVKEEQQGQNVNGDNASNGTDNLDNSTSMNEAETDNPLAEHPDNTDAHEEPDAEPPMEPEEDPIVTPEEPQPVTITDATWIAVGDIMMHMPQLPGYYDKQQKRYFFNPYFERVKDIIGQGDWKLANLETPIAGASMGYSGFPRFNAPTELAEALAYAGFNIVTTANNHSLDRGAEGISRTMKALEQQQFVMKGTARSLTESQRITMVEQKGIRMGLLAYTYGTNGIPLPDKMPYAVSLIDEQAMIQSIKQLKSAGADFVTVVLHFGTEYQTAPSEAQKTLARKLIAAGADIIAGSHPHVVQPYELVDVQEQDGATRRGLIIYSMGNFISNQRGETKDYGVIMKVALQKNSGTGKTVIQSVEPIPTWVHRYKQNGTNRYEILPVASTIQSKTNERLSSSDYAVLKKNLDLLTDRLSSMSAQPVSVETATP
ncbi:poly-gamma-glutamate synthesis protein (capsule biosynthesis protein) [Paenibacillus phyllosphaerae]|uniref:Poly-gamma-glutamate synthesis protein (Capsule biosynthesis protein) n=1 Tax=Paenibacillus phyllosphaerae TaxID=274593 RepID=A0A7W5AXR8_9BACL|nr:CapA family protein [Paenibacillus phyllosphaerae]MBB3110424.1 poly-gamma-glutamate synthesis protein (capsule biosynthesis protein) [Paenibacillus phyllosphaerae]